MLILPRDARDILSDTLLRGFYPQSLFLLVFAFQNYYRSRQGSRYQKGKPPKRIIPEDKYNFIDQHWRDVQEGVPDDFETEIITKNGEIKYLEVAHTLTTIKGEKKVVSVTRDITEYKKLELSLKESDARYRELFENAYDPMYTHDLDGVFLSINKIGLKILGGSEEEVIGSNISKWLTPESYRLFRERVQKIHAGLPLEEPVTIEVVCKNGEHRWGEIGTRLIKDKGKIIVHGIARDITENMILKQELKKSNISVTDLIMRIN